MPPAHVIGPIGDASPMAAPKEKAGWDDAGAELAVAGKLGAELPASRANSVRGCQYMQPSNGRNLALSWGNLHPLQPCRHRGGHEWS